MTKPEHSKRRPVSERTRWPWKTSRVCFAACMAVILTPVDSSGGDTAGGEIVGSVTIHKRIGKRRDHSDVVVYLEGARSSATKGPFAEAEIRQKDKTFSPAVLPVKTGTTVEFPNDDRIFHNVFSVSSGAQFDLGLYKQGEAKSVTFNTPAVVDVYCNIHPEMSASVVVLDSDYFTVTGKDGRFRIPDVPPGTYTIVAWQRRGEPTRGTIEVERGKTATISLDLRETATVERHTRKDGTPYGRYK